MNKDELLKLKRDVSNIGNWIGINAKDRRKGIIKQYKIRKVPMKITLKEVVRKMDKIKNKIEYINRDKKEFKELKEFVGTQDDRYECRNFQDAGYPHTYSLAGRIGLLERKLSEINKKDKDFEILENKIKDLESEVDALKDTNERLLSRDKNKKK